MGGLNLPTPTDRGIDPRSGHFSERDLPTPGTFEYQSRRRERLVDRLVTGVFP